MSNDSSNDPLTYNQYLHVPDLIDLQNPRSTHHDELLFITIHQAYELWFKQILHEIDAAIAMMNEDRLAAAARALRRIVEIEKLLVAQIHILETMSPINFLAFRDRLVPASGFQSMQFREIEFASGLKHENLLQQFREDEFAFARLQKRLAAPSLGEVFFAALRRRGLDAPADEASAANDKPTPAYEQRTQAVLELLTHSEDRYEEYQLSETLLEHDEYFSLWRSHHVKMVARMIGTKPGTGGSAGVEYLRATLDKKFFPELWEARTYLDTKHGEAGCPFAKEQVKVDDDLSLPDPEHVDKLLPRTPKPKKRALGKERRRAPRCKVNLRALWEGDLGQHQADVTSLSSNGCFVLSGGSVKPKELIRLEIMLPNDEPIHLWAEVVEEANEIGFAMQFTSAEPAELARLEVFLKGCLATES